MHREPSSPVFRAKRRAAGGLCPRARARVVYMPSFVGYDDACRAPPSRVHVCAECQVSERGRKRNAMLPAPHGMPKIESQRRGTKKTTWSSGRSACRPRPAQGFRMASDAHDALEAICSALHTLQGFRSLASVITAELIS